MMPGKPKGQIDMNVLEELADFLSKRGGSEEMGEEPSDGAKPALEVEIGAAPGGGEHTMPDGTSMKDSEMGGQTCPHCGKPY